jgi:L-threonylcarbamoyladenylate synthase
VPALVLPVDPRRPDPAAVAAAARALRDGLLVVLPTETVYGLAALERLRAAKGRDGEKPFTLHLADAAALRARHPRLAPSARRLLDGGALPGPLTLVLDAPGGGTEGVRLPDDAVAVAVLRACPFPVVASSVNAAGEPPAITGSAAAAFAREVAAVVLDAGPSRLGLPSTVVRCAGEGVRILREGAVPGPEVRRLAGVAG